MNRLPFEFVKPMIEPEKKPCVTTRIKVEFDDLTETEVIITTDDRVFTIQAEKIIKILNPNRRVDHISTELI